MRTQAPTALPILQSVNILPPPIGDGDPIKILRSQVTLAREAGLTSAWVNPINVIPGGTAVHRLDLDTGIHSDQHMSLYAPNNPQQVRSDLTPRVVRNWVSEENANNHFRVLIDFVWKHVSIHSSLRNSKPKWFGKKILKDVIEYDLATKDQTVRDELFQHIKDTAHLFLDKENGYGFDGLRIDSASHLNPELRIALYQYIQTTFPNAIILEECLFDSKQTTLIEQLAQEADQHKVWSSFITSNLYYQRAAFNGELNNPRRMNDITKLRLAQNHGISFTGNHDHFSAGWSIVLTMAADRIVRAHDFMEKVKKITTSTHTNDNFDLDELMKGITYLNALNHIHKKGDEHQGRLPEELEPEQASCIRYLLPYANEIVREMLDSENPARALLVHQFRLRLFERIANRTMPAQSGYFVLYNELVSPFCAQRIFFNKNNQPLSQLFLTVNDLKQDMALTTKILEAMLADKTGFNNAKNFGKTINGLNTNKKVKGKVKAKDKRTAVKTYTDDDLRLWLPFIIEFLRDNPEMNTYACYLDQSISIAISRLQVELKTVSFIKAINEIFCDLTTPQCVDYHTFTAQTVYKIFVRCAETTTDIIILNLDTSLPRTVDHMDIQKIALWFQARIYPPETVGLKNSLVPPFNGLDVAYIDRYADLWKVQTPPELFDHAYTRITGASANHQTNLYLGLGLTLDPSVGPKDNFSIKKHVKSETQAEHETVTSENRYKVLSRDTSPTHLGKLGTFKKAEARDTENETGNKTRRKLDL